MLTVQNLSYHLQKKALLNAITLSFVPKIIHGILGPNGSGKSTLLKTLAGIWKPSQGSVLWNEENLFKKERREISKIVTLVPQNPQLFFDFTVEEFVFMGRYAHGEKRNPKEQIQHALELVDALQFKDRPVNQLSLGERQRVYIARALCSEAPVMLFDEPTANLDIRHQIDIWLLLQTLALDGKTVIVTNHDWTSTQQFCDQIYILHHGYCHAAGSFTEVMTPNLIHDVFGI